MPILNDTTLLSGIYLDKRRNNVMAGNIDPATSDYDLGRTTNKWGEIHVVDLYADNISSSGGAIGATISGGAPTLTFEDTTVGDDDWRIRVDADTMTFQQNVADASWESKITFAGNIGIGFHQAAEINNTTGDLGLYGANNVYLRTTSNTISLRGTSDVNLLNFDTTFRTILSGGNSTGTHGRLHLHGSGHAEASRIYLYTGTEEVMRAWAGETYFNAGAVNRIFRVASDNDANVLYINGADDGVRIGGSGVYSAKFYVLSNQDNHPYGVRNRHDVSVSPAASIAANLAELFITSGVPTANRSHAGFWSQLDWNTAFDKNAVGTSVAGLWIRHDNDQAITATGGGTITQIGVQFENYLQDGSSGVIDNVYGLYLTPLAFKHASSTATITNLYGVRVLNSNYAGTITGTAYGLRISNMFADTNQYGIYLDAMTGASSTNYSIYSAGGESYHAGRIRIGVSGAAIGALDISANTEQYLLRTTAQKATGDGVELTGFVTTPTVNAGTQTASMHGGYFNPRVASTATHSGIVYGIYARVDNTSSNTLSTSRALQIVNPSGSGVITNNYGVYVDSMTRGGTLNYAIYTNTGSVRFGDRTHIEVGDSVSPAPNTNYDDLVIENNAFAGMTFLAPDTQGSGIFFGGPAAVGYHGINAFNSTHASRAGEWDITVANAARIHLSASIMEFQQAQTLNTVAASTHSLTFAPDGDVIHNPTANTVRPLTNWDIDLGSITRKYKTLWVGEVRADALVAEDIISTIGGRVVVIHTTKLIAAVTDVATTIDVEHNQIRSGDRLLLMDRDPVTLLPKIEAMAATSGPTTITGGFRYTVTRNLDGTGANEWDEGDAVQNTGTTGTGWIEMYATSSMLGQQFEYIFVDDGGVFSANHWDNNNFEIFPTVAIVNDAIYFGFENTSWQNVFFNLGVAGVYTGVTFAYEYWDTVTGGGSWQAMTTTATPNFAATGYTSLEFLAASQTNWGATTINSQSAYWIRIRISALSTWTTSPAQTGGRIQSNKSQYGPTIVGWERQSTTWNDFSEIWAVGRLDGLYGYADDDVTGIGLGSYLIGSWLTIDDTSGIRAYRSSGAEVMSIVPGGDITLGEVITDNANIFWDQTAGRLNFRGSTNGTVIQAYIDTDGSIAAGGGDVLLNNTGITIAMGIGNTNRLRWTDAVATDAYIGTNYNGTTFTEMEIYVNGPGTAGTDVAQIQFIVGVAAAEISSGYSYTEGGYQGWDFQQDIRVGQTAVIGSNTLSGDGMLHVWSGNAGSVGASPNADELVLENAGPVGLSMLSPNNQIARILFGDPDHSGIGSIYYDHNDNSLNLFANAARRFTVYNDDNFSNVVYFGNYNLARNPGGGITAAGTLYPFAVATPDRALTAEKWGTAVNVQTTNNGSNFWTVRLRRNTSAGALSTVSTVNTSADAANTWVKKTVDISSANSGTDMGYVIEVERTGSPGALFMYAPWIVLK